MELNVKGLESGDRGGGGGRVVWVGYEYLHFICLSGDEFNMTFPHWEERYEVLLFQAIQGSKCSTFVVLGFHTSACRNMVFTASYM